MSYNTLNKDFRINKGKLLDKRWTIVFGLSDNKTTCVIYNSNDLQMGYARVKGRDEKEAFNIAYKQAMDLQARYDGNTKQQKGVQTFLFGDKEND